MLRHESSLNDLMQIYSKIIYASDWGNWGCICNHLPRLEYEQYFFHSEIKGNNIAYVDE